MRFAGTEIVVYDLEFTAWNGMTCPLPAGAFRDIREELSDLLGIDSASAESGRLWQSSSAPPPTRSHDALADALASAYRPPED